MKSLQKIRNLLKVASTDWGYEYSSYHTLRLGGESIEGQRDPLERLSKIPINFQGKSVLDLGCNVGGLLFSLQDTLAFGVGVDKNPKLINAANKIKTLQSHKNYLHFYTVDLEKDLSEIVNFLPYDSLKVDVCFFLSLSLHLKGWEDVLDFALKISDQVVFESHGSEAEQESQIKYIQKFQVEPLSKSEDDQLIKNRQLFLLKD